MAIDRCNVHGITFDLDRTTDCPICECASDVERYGIEPAHVRKRSPEKAVHLLPAAVGDGTDRSETWPRFRGSSGHVQTG